jgi:hypothetical protein
VVDGGFTGEFRRCIAVKRSMYPVQIVILAEICQLSLRVAGIPEERLVKKFAANGFNQPIDEGMR